MKKCVLGWVIVTIFCSFVVGFLSGCDDERYSTETAGEACFHEYKIEYFWQGYDSCKAKATCKKCENFIEENGVVLRDEQPKKVATCTSSGEYIWTASFTNKLFSDNTKIETTDALSHSYEKEVEWSKNLQNEEYCRVKLNCKTCGDVKEMTTYNITITAKTNATCTSEGEIKYTAKFDDGTTITKSETIKKSHNYDTTYVWNKDKNGAIISCEAWTICSECSNSKNKYKQLIERISVESMEKQEVNGGYRYVAKFKTSGLETQYSNEIEQSPAGDSPTQTEESSEETEYSTGDVSSYVIYTAEKIDEGLCKIYFEGTCVLKSATYEIEETICKITDCEFTFDFGDITFCLSDENFIQFEIDGEKDGKTILKFEKKSSKYISKFTLKCSETDNTNLYGMPEREIPAYIEFYADNSACLFVNIVDNIYFPFQIFTSYEEKGENTIEIDYYGETLTFEVENVNS